MSNVEAQVEAPETFRVPIVKAKGLRIDGQLADHLDVDVEQIPRHTWKGVIDAGLKKVLNDGATKVEKGDLQKAHDIALERLEKMYAGTLKIGGRASGDLPADVKAEAMKIAKEMIDNQLRALGKNPRHFDAKDKTAKAKELVMRSPQIVEQARRNLEVRKLPDMKIDLTGLNASEAAIAKATRVREATKPASAGQLSKAKASKTVIHAQH